jgi:hypothetical protein
MSTPADHGYVRCARCKTWRRIDETRPPKEAGYFIAPEHALVKPVCIDIAWCGSQAGVGKGELSADTGNTTGRPQAAPDSSERGEG